MLFHQLWVLYKLTDAVVADIQTCHHPDGEKYIRGRTDDILLYLLALGEEGSHNHSARSAQAFAAKVCFSHVRLHGNDFLIAEGDGL